jgi:tetratricopeptide (TPR) repeat protein
MSNGRSPERQPRPAAGRRRADSSARGAPAWAWAVPALAALVLYARALRFAFVWDDWDLIVRNAALQGPEWGRTLVQDFWQSTGGGTGMWRPLVTLSYRVDGVLSQWQPWAFHLVNVLAHAVSSALVARLALARRIPPALAMAAGLVFASTPAASESVAWIAGRTDAFAAAFTLAAVLLARAWRVRRSRLAGAAALLCAAFALLAKESALVLPLLLAADAADAKAEPERAGVRDVLVPGLVLVALWAIAHRLVVPGSSHPASPGAAAGLAAIVWAHLAWLAPWAPHAPLLDRWQAPAPAVAAVAWVGLAALVVLAARLARRRVPLLLPLALLVLPLLPVAAASLLETGVRFAERALVLPAAGLALALAWARARAPVARRRWATASLVAWAALQTAFALAPIAAWADDAARIRRIAETRPRDVDALLGLADLLSTEGKPDQALGWIQRAEAVAPGSAAPLVARASLAYRAGANEEALGLAVRALALEPGDLAAGVIRVRSLAKLARAGEANAAADSLLAAHPGAAPALGAQGVARLAAGDAAGALAPLTEASRQLLDDAGLAWDLGRAAIATDRVALAREAFERAVRAAPGFYDAWLGVADTRARLGDVGGAEQALARAASLPGASDGRVEMLRTRIGQRPSR